MADSSQPKEVIILKAGESLSRDKKAGKKFQNAQITMSVSYAKTRFSESPLIQASVEYNQPGGTSAEKYLGATGGGNYNAEEFDFTVSPDCEDGQEYDDCAYFVATGKILPDGNLEVKIYF